VSLSDSRLSDLAFFSELLRYSSMQEMARTKGVQPSTVSKIVSRLEAMAGRRLVERSRTGYRVTDEGRNLIRLAQPLLEQVRQYGGQGRQARSPTWVTIACPNLVSTRLLPGALASCRERYPRQAYRLLDLAPAESLHAALSGFFDVIFHWGGGDWPRSWHSVEVGPVRFGLFGRAGHPLGAEAEEGSVLGYPFVMPTYWMRDQVLAADDRCPAPRDCRKAGDLTGTGESALHLVAASDQLVFVPVFLAQELVRARRIQEIRCAQWAEVAPALHLSVRAGTVAQPFLRQLVAGLRAGLSLSRAKGPA
jgi:DNA-binding transcriptional LysR family regulator